MADQVVFSCKICLQVFSRNADLRRHVHRAHAETRPPSPLKVGRKAKKPSTSAMCSLCDKTFSNKNSLSSHRRKKHCDAVRAATLQVSGKPKDARRVQTEKVTLEFNSVTGKTQDSG